MKKAACFSVAALDYFPQINQHFAGGNALNQAINFRALGWETAFLGALGTDVAGDQIENLLEQGWRPEDLALLTTGSRHPEQVARQE